MDEHFRGTHERARNHIFCMIRFFEDYGRDAQVVMAYFYLRRIRK
jgi:hypothetical protein